MNLRLHLTPAFIAIGAALLAACASPRPPAEKPEEREVVAAAEARRHELSVRVLSVQQDGTRVSVRDEIHLSGPSSSVRFWLDDTARIDAVLVDGRPTQVVPDEADSEEFEASAWRTIDGAESTLTVQLTLELRPPPAGPRRSHHWHDGGFIYLPEATAWYPRLGKERTPAGIDVTVPSGSTPIASGVRIPQPAATAGETAVRFEAESPANGVTLLVGPWEQSTERVDGVDITVLLTPEREHLAETLAEASRAALGRLTAALGPYPFPSFAVVEIPIGNLVSYPGLALVDPRSLSRRETFAVGIEHEMAHSWLGHTVLRGVGGNWVEGLTTYIADHGVHSDHSLAASRRLRKQLLRNHHARVLGEGDLPASLFQRSRTTEEELVGYSKVAMVFHMLRLRIGDSAFFGALRTLVQERSQVPTTWDELLLVFEKSSGESLARFAVEWLDRTSAPGLELASATVLGPVHDAAAGPTSAHRIELEIEQTDPPYELDLPIGIELMTGEHFRVVESIPAKRRTVVSFEVPAFPVRATLDPDYDLFRVLNDDEIEQTIGDVLDGSPSSLVVVDDQEVLRRGAELALAAGLGGEVEVTDTASDRTLRVLLATPLALDALGLRPALVSEAQLASGALSPTQTLVVAHRHDGQPAVSVLVGDVDATAAILLELPSLRHRSYVIFEGATPTRAGLWSAPASSVSKPFGQQLP